jgi:hypothetical protein
MGEGKERKQPGCGAHTSATLSHKSEQDGVISGMSSGWAIAAREDSMQKRRLWQESLKIGTRDRKKQG